MDSTAYYNSNAENFIGGSINADMSEIRNKFISYLPAIKDRHDKLKILDAGCGSGRDSKAFMELGFEVSAIDASEAMIEYCRKTAGINAELATFSGFMTDLRFDGIWACASFLHILQGELTAVIEKFIGFLKPGGVFFISFKYGNNDYVKDNRYFNCHTPETLSELVSVFDNMEILENFVTEDVRDGRSGENWTSVILRKRVDRHA